LAAPSFAAIGYAELRFASVARRAIVSIEKQHPFLLPIGFAELGAASYTI
jgi:hypothetical protein